MERFVVERQKKMNKMKSMYQILCFICINGVVCIVKNREGKFISYDTEAMSLGDIFTTENESCDLFITKR
jgi:hypothetical protein